jgi:hypothetical protein
MTLVDKVDNPLTISPSTGEAKPVPGDFMSRVTRSQLKSTSKTPDLPSSSLSSGEDTSAHDSQQVAHVGEGSNLFPLSGQLQGRSKAGSDNQLRGSIADIHTKPQNPLLKINRGRFAVLPEQMDFDMSMDPISSFPASAQPTQSTQYSGMDMPFPASESSTQYSGADIPFPATVNSTPTEEIPAWVTALIKNVETLSTSISKVVVFQQAVARNVEKIIDKLANMEI